jgi:CRISP-associated protein Cas1
MGTTHDRRQGPQLPDLAAPQRPRRPLHHGRLPQTPAEQARETNNFASLLGIEGIAARLYFGAFPTMLADTAAEFAAEFSLLGRNRRPTRDPVNALLSFCYSMLTKDLVTVTLGVGLDPYLGIYHRSRHGRPALALDLAEESRPLIADSVTVGLLNNGEIGPSDFTRRAGGVALTLTVAEPCRAPTNGGCPRRSNTPVFGYRISYRRVLDVQARLLAAHLVGEVPEYQPMVTR